MISIFTKKKKLIAKIRSLLFTFFKLLVPELSILKRNINWNSLTDYSSLADISENAKINSPFQLSDISIGNFTYVDINSFISVSDIGKFCSIGPNLICGWGIHPTNGLSTAPMFYSTKKQNGVTLSSIDKLEERKRINIGNDVFIGANVTVLDGVTIGDGAIIGAGAVVSKDIPPFAIAVGCPIKVIKYRFNKAQIEALLRIKWWDFSPEILIDVEALFFDIDTFIMKYDPIYNNH
jgi:acetyltransferase-like isoleucine patch superfamily enzyme